MEGIDRTQSSESLEFFESILQDDGSLDFDVTEGYFPFDATAHYTERGVNLPTNAGTRSVAQDGSVDAVLLEIERSPNNKRSTCLISYDSGSFSDATISEKDTNQHGYIDHSIASLSSLTPTDETATDEDLLKHREFIKDACTNGRITATKASKFEGILHPGRTWKDMTLELLHESIPKKRTKKDVEGEDKPVKGYKCRICKVPLKGHVCPYCEVCSTPEKKHKKDEDGNVHVCINCPTCYDENKKKKKLVQLKIGKCMCIAHG